MSALLQGWEHQARIRAWLANDKDMLVYVRTHTHAAQLLRHTLR